MMPCLDLAVTILVGQSCMKYKEIHMIHSTHGGMFGLFVGYLYGPSVQFYDCFGNEQTVSTTTTSLGKVIEGVLY